MILIGDARTALRDLPDGSVHVCCTSPPYFGLRSYLPKDDPSKLMEIGGEQSPKEYVAHLVEVFREVRRVLRDDGTLWLNLSDTYAGGGNGGGGSFTKDGIRRAEPGTDKNKAVRYGKRGAIDGIKPKDLIGIPWMVAFALRDDGWYLRQWIPWIKPNGMPESCDDRPSSACELIFFLSKSGGKPLLWRARDTREWAFSKPKPEILPDGRQRWKGLHYYYDYDAVRLPASMSFINDKRHQTGSSDRNIKLGYEESKAQNPKSPHRMFANKKRGHSRRHDGFNDRWDAMERQQQCSGWRATRNSDWFFEGLLSNENGEPLAFVGSPANYPEAHFATWPQWLVRPMILAGSPVGGTVLDPFAGSGTTGRAALELGRNPVLVELNPQYQPLINQRLNVTKAML